MQYKTLKQSKQTKRHLEISVAPAAISTCNMLKTRSYKNDCSPFLLWLSFAHKQSQTLSQLKIQPVCVCVSLKRSSIRPADCKSSAIPRYTLAHMERSAHTQQQLPFVQSSSLVATSAYTCTEEVKQTHCETKNLISSLLASEIDM